MKVKTVTAIALLCPALAWAQSEPRIEIEMDATRIKANKELPQLLYIVPWKDADLSDSAGERKITIHDLFGEFYQPIMPLGESAEAEKQEGP